MENTIFGIAFWAIGLANTLLMFKLWGYPFDHERLASSAPRSLMLLHRGLGYVFLAIYIYLMVQMVPRLWAYQVELPARTVAHLVMGMAIGALLFVKILTYDSSGIWSPRRLRSSGSFSSSARPSPSGYRLPASCARLT